MERQTLAVSLGLLSILLMPTLPNVWIAMAMLLLGCLLFKTLTTTASFIIGISVCILSINLHFKDLTYLLPANSTIKGVIVSLPEQGKYGNRFYFKLSEIVHQDSSRESSAKLLIMWPGVHTLKQGQRWQFNVKVKPLSGLFNQGGFNYQRYLVAKGIIAQGIVSSAYPINLVPDTRAKASIKLLNSLDELKYARFISALVIGDKREFTKGDWQVMRGTGTSHLFAISGLHLGLVALFVGTIVNFIIGLFTQNFRTIRVTTLTITIISAGFYSYLAGFSDPTIRAFVMLVIACCFFLLKQRFRPFHILIITFPAIALFNPLSLLSQGLWLSLFAVAVVFFAVSKIQSQYTDVMSIGQRFIQWWIRLIKLQCTLAVGLYFIQIAFFGGVSLIAPFANLFAVPLVSLVILPLLLLASVLLMVFDESVLSHYLYVIADWFLGLLFSGLTQLSAIDSLWINNSTTIIGIFLLLIVFYKIASAMTLLNWRHYSAVTVLSITCALITNRITTDNKDWRVDFLDVGHGNSAVVTKDDRAFIIDTGNVFGEESTIAEMVIAPWLMSQHLTKVDMLFLTHQDSDHAAGRKFLKGMFTDMVVIDNNDLVCVRGEMNWRGLNIKMIKANGLTKKRDIIENNRSCLIRISNAYGSVLFTGDIERGAEKQLLKQMDQSWQANVMQVPHHGSKTSSTKAFISFIQPQIAVVSARAFNRWHFPEESVKTRYARAKARLLSTGKDGQVSIEFSDNRPHITTYRGHRSPFWYNGDLSFGHYQR